MLLKKPEDQFRKELRRLLALGIKRFTVDTEGNKVRYVKPEIYQWIRDAGYTYWYEGDILHIEREDWKWKVKNTIS